jgi:hypothetical protein
VLCAAEIRNLDLTSTAQQQITALYISATSNSVNAITLKTRQNVLIAKFMEHTIPYSKPHTSILIHL